MVELTRPRPDALPIPADASPARRGRRLLAALRQDVKGWMLAVPALLCLAIYEWGPLLTTVKDSFYSMTGFNTTGFVGTENFRWVLGNPEFREVFVNTLKYVGWSFLIGFPLPVIMAIVISELPRLNGFFRVCVYMPALVPSVIASLMWTDLYSASANGLVNRFIGFLGFSKSQLLLDPHLTIALIVITMTWTGFGATTILYSAAVSGINRALYEAAALDGASYLRRAWHVTLPQLRKLMALFFILQLIGVFQVLIQPLVMTNGGPDEASESLLLFTYDLAFKYYKTADSDAVGVITFVCLLVVTFFYIRANFSKPDGRRQRRRSRSRPQVRVQRGRA